MYCCIQIVKSLHGRHYLVWDFVLAYCQSPMLACYCFSLLQKAQYSSAAEELACVCRGGAGDQCI